MKKINQELIALFDKYGSDRRRALRENKKLSYLYALADLRENLLDWYQFDPEQHALQIGADAGALPPLPLRPQTHGGDPGRSLSGWRSQ